MRRSDTSDSQKTVWRLTRGEGPLLAVSLHSGHDLRPEVAARLRLPEEHRRREEDPFTDRWTSVGDSALIVDRSRFEVDLNRPRESAVYRRPEDAWGLELWDDEPPAALVDRSLAIYDAFYTEVEALLRSLERRFGRFVVLDVHSYNHRRGGPDAPPDDPAENPEVNLGTGSLDRDLWSGVVERFLERLGACELAGRRLDVRENVRFRGGWFSQWVHRTFPRTGCVLAVEWKKIFMDEWTGEPDEAAIGAIGEAMQAAAAAVRDELGLEERAA